MNAVKRCLALIAATVAIGACKGDSTADLAGANLTIRATPGAVWMRKDQPTTILIEAVDATGGPQPGSWTAAVTGPVTVILDSTYQATSTGPIGNGRQFLVAAATEGDASVTFTGTGGTRIVPIRVAPAPTGLNLTFTAPSAPDVHDTVTVPLNTVVTATATVGTRFTSSTAVRMMTGPLTTNNSFFAVKNFSITPDSLSLSFLPGPNSTGQVEVSGIASLSTPTLTSTARTHTTLKTDLFDTVSTNRLAMAAIPVAIGDTVTVTLPATYRFSPNTGVTNITDTVINGVAQTVTTNGLANPFIISVSADSGTIKYFPAPGAKGRPRFSNIRVRATPTFWAFAARTSSSYTIPSIALSATYGPSNNVAVNTPVTITMPAGFKLRPNSTISTFGTLNGLVLARAADSSSITVLPAPGATNKTVTIDSILYTAAPVFKLSMPVTTNLTVGALADLGPDDPLNSATFAAPTVTGNSIGWYDKYTMSQPDPSGATCDGAVGAQFYTLTVSVSGNYNIQMNWSNGSDFDFGIMVKDGTYGGPGCSNYITTAGLASSKPEKFTVALTAGTTYVINAMDFAGDGSGYVRMQVTKVP